MSVVKQEDLLMPLSLVMSLLPSMMIQLVFKKKKLTIKWGHGLLIKVEHNQFSIQLYDKRDIFPFLL